MRFRNSGLNEYWTRETLDITTLDISNFDIKNIGVAQLWTWETLDLTYISLVKLCLICKKHWM